MKACRHRVYQPQFADDGVRFVEFARLCERCGETLSLGPANDDDPNVQVEIEAARTAVGEPLEFVLHAHNFRDCLPCYLARAIHDHDKEAECPTTSPK